MITAAFGVLAALAFVLGLGALALWALKRFSGGTLVLRGSRARVPIEVVQRVALGPKTGLAVVRVQVTLGAEKPQLQFVPAADT